MNMRRIRAFSVIAAGVAVLTACVPVRDGRYNDPYYDPYAGGAVGQDVYSDRVYRASDGRVFSTRADRDYYQTRLNRGNALTARDRRIAERQRLRAAERRQRLAEEERLRRRLERRDLTRAERQRLRAERLRREREADARRRNDAAEAERQRLRAERRQRRLDADDQARRNARAAERERRRAERAEADRQAEREARRAERERRRQSRLSGGIREDTTREVPEGWTRSTHDGRDVYIDSEGRIRNE